MQTDYTESIIDFAAKCQVFERTVILLLFWKVPDYIHYQMSMFDILSSDIVSSESLY